MDQNLPDLYAYKAKVTSVYDGDTFTADVDLGFRVQMEMHFRMLGINTPEIKTGTDDSKKKAREARDYLKHLILDQEVVIRTKKDKQEKYGRWLATVYISTPNDTDTGTVNVNQLMIANGYAVPFMTED